MITVIDEYSSDVANLYEGKSLADACDMMVLETYQAVSDFKMDILLTEHAYLYENSCEISYVTEAGEETKEGKSLGQKIDGLIEKVRKFIGDLFAKIQDWFEERIADINTFFAKIGLNKKKFNEALSKLEASKLVVKGSKWAFDDKIESAFMSTDGFFATYQAGRELYGPNEYFNEYAAKLDSGDYEACTKAQLEKAGKIVFESSTVVKNIKTARKNCDDQLKALKKNALANKNDDMSEVVKGIDGTLKSNAYVCKDKIKLYQKYLNANVEIVRDVVRSYKKNPDAFAKEKEADVHYTSKSSKKMDMGDQSEKKYMSQEEIDKVIARSKQNHKAPEAATRPTQYFKALTDSGMDKDQAEKLTKQNFPDFFKNFKESAQFYTYLDRIYEAYSMLSDSESEVSTRYFSEA